MNCLPKKSDDSWVSLDMDEMKEKVQELDENWNTLQDMLDEMNQNLICEEKKPEENIFHKDALAWWNVAFGYAYEWLQDSFWVQLQKEIQCMLLQSNIEFCWPNYYMEKEPNLSLLSSFATLLSNYTNEKNEIHEEWKDQLDGILLKKEAISTSIHSHYQKLEKEYHKYNCNPTLQEVCKGIQNIIDWMTEFEKRKLNEQVSFQQKYRNVNIYSLQCLLIVQEWLKDQIIIKVKKRVQLYEENNLQSKKELEQLGNEIEQEQQKVKSMFVQFQNEYHSYLNKVGLSVKEKNPAVAHAFDLISSIQFNNQYFDKENIKLLQMYIEHIKKYSESIDVPENENEITKQQIKKIKQLKTRIETLQSEISNCSNEIEKKVELQKLIQEFKECEKQVKEQVTRYKKESFKDSFYSSSQQLWMISLAKFEQKFEQLMTMITKKWEEKIKIQTRIEYEICNSLSELAEICKSKYIEVCQDITNHQKQELDSLLQLQHQQKTKNQTDLSVWFQWTNTLERKLVYYQYEGEVFKEQLIELKQIQSELDILNEQELNVEQFIEEFYQLLPIWNTLYSKVD